MSVRIARLKNGEDIICDLFEVSTKEYPDKVIAFQLKDPYNLAILDEDQFPLDIETDESTGSESFVDEFKEIEPDIDMRPWAPFASKKELMVKPDDVLTIYETYPEIIDKYNELVEKANGRFTGEVDPT